MASADDTLRRWRITTRRHCGAAPPATTAPAVVMVPALVPTMVPAAAPARQQAPLTAIAGFLLAASSEILAASGWSGPRRAGEGSSAF